MIISQAHDAAVGFGDRLHDSQAQPGALPVLAVRAKRTNGWPDDFSGNPLP